MKQPINTLFVISCIAIGAAAVLISGCSGGYSNSWPYPENISTVYVEMFDSKSFRRDHEYDLTDAICKKIEAHTPYKIVSDRDCADTVLSGQINNIRQGTLTMERHTGRPLENEVKLSVEMNWKNLQTGEIIIGKETVYSAASFSKFLGQDFEYASQVAVNKAADRIVERMQKQF